MWNVLFNVIKGMVMGVGAILPGISGGVLCVVFGIYEPMMAFLAHPIKEFKTSWRLLLPVLIGFAAGFMLLAKGVEWLFRTAESEATWFFIGLIVGSLPPFFRQAGSKGRGTWCWVALAVSFAAAMLLFCTLNGRGSVTIEPNVFVWLCCGVLWGLSIIVPGMSSSAIYIYFGILQPMTAGIAALTPSVVLPLAAGIVITVALLARGVDALFRRAHGIAYHAIFGFVLASTLVILPLNAASLAEWLIYAACFAGGVLLAWGMELFPKQQ